MGNLNKMESKVKDIKSNQNSKERIDSINVLALTQSQEVQISTYQVPLFIQKTTRRIQVIRIVGN